METGPDSLSTDPTHVLGIRIMDNMLEANYCLPKIPNLSKILPGF